jgi:hypothetical protein
MENQVKGVIATRVKNDNARRDCSLLHRANHLVEVQRRILNIHSRVGLRVNPSKEVISVDLKGMASEKK